MQWLSEKNPYLAFRLLSQVEKTYHFPIINFSIQEDAEVLFIEGVMRSLSSILPFLARGGIVVFIEKNIEKIAPFLSSSDFIFHSNIDIILDEEGEYQKIAKKHLFKKQQFIGKLEKFRYFLDSYHMSISEYSDLGKTIIRNIQANLLHAKLFIDGREWKGRFEGKPVILCGSGPSIDENREKILELQKSNLIFAAGSSIPKLLSWGVRIDAGFFVDPWPPIDLYELLKDHSFPLFYQNRMSQDLFKMHSGPKIWMGFSPSWEIEKWIYKEIGLDSFIFDAGWNVGCFALHVAHFLSANPITLIGMDGGEKRDLKEGVKWMNEFLKNPPNLDYGVFFENKIDQKKLQNVIQKLNEPSMNDSINRFLEKLKAPLDSKGFQRAKILLEVDLEGEPLYEFLIKPLWEKFKSLYVLGSKDEVIPLALFAKRVLIFQQTFKFYPDGCLCSKETDDGLAEIFYESGEKKGRAAYSKGLLNGEYSLFAKNGVLLRSGNYQNGKKEGFHVVRGEEGNERIIAEFHEDRPLNRYLRMNEKGVVIEELFYHDGDKFDRKLFSEVGELQCEGLFKGSQYTEKQFERGNLVSDRSGIWKDGKLVWD